MVSTVKKTGLQNYLAAEKKDKEKYIGLESLEEETFEEDQLPYDLINIRIEQKTITVYQIEHWIRQGRLNLTPEYQRNLVWNDQRKSALIESLMLKIPIPSFYLDEGDNGQKSVIDGMQRLTTIHSFLNDQFSLKGLQYLSSYENKTFSQLDIKFQGIIEDTIFNINILSQQCPQMVKFDIFRRVNTGGVPLNFQEIRNIMAVPKVRTLLREMAVCEEFLYATGHRINDVRMNAQELCLRYLTILYCYDWEQKELKNYTGLLRSMDNMILQLNHLTDEQHAHTLKEFKKVMLQCYEILGKTSFCKPKSRLINKSLFTGWAVVLTNMKLADNTLHGISDKIFNKYQDYLKTDMAFFNAITSSTGTRGHLLLSLEVIRNIMEEFIHVQ